MSRQRHLIALALAAVLSVGCYDRPPKPSMYGPRSDDQLVVNEGDRVVVRDSDGEPLLKLRTHDSGRWDVFDKAMSFAGQVRLEDGQVEWRAGRANEWRSATVADETWTMPGSVRLEALRDGWTVFDSKNEMLGYLRLVDGRWERRDSFDGAATWTADEGDLVEIATDQSLARVGESPGDGVLIASTFHEIGVVGRVALGRFVESTVASEVVGEVEKLANEKAAARAAASGGTNLVDAGAAEYGPFESALEAAPDAGSRAGDR